MDYNFYLKGLSATDNELNSIEQKFDNMGLKLYPVGINYEELYKKNEIRAFNCLNNDIYYNHGIFPCMPNKINLICHSMGCNLGVTFANLNNNVGKLVLISPEITKISNEEKEAIIQNRKNSNIYTPKKTKLNLQKIKSIILFLKSQKWAEKNIIELLEKNIDILCIYSNGDEFVSQNYIHQLANHPNVSEYEVDSNNHNPLLDNDDKVYDKIKEFLK